jgi:SAM-dependent methyltransferase
MTTHTGEVAALFDEWALAGRAEGMERTHERAARAGFELLEIGEGDRYLDIGCGNGYTVRWAADAGAREAVGVDVSAEMIARARERCRDVAAATFICGEFPAVPLEPASFDGVFSMEVFYYIDDLDAALEATAGLLVPGGRFACVVDYYRENRASHSWADDLGLSLHLLGEDEWRERMTRAGFEIVGQRRVRAAPTSDNKSSWQVVEGGLLTVCRAS